MRQLAGHNRTSAVTAFPRADFASFGLHVISCKLRVEVHLATGAQHVSPFESRVGQLRQYPYSTESMFATTPFRNRIRCISLLGPKL